jgi:hypothetical protein
MLFLQSPREKSYISSSNPNFNRMQLKKGEFESNAIDLDKKAGFSWDRWTGTGIPTGIIPRAGTGMVRKPSP